MIDGTERDAQPGGYAPPTITDLGTLVDVTRSSSLFFGHTSSLHDLALSGVPSPGGGAPAPSAPGGTHVVTVTPTTGVGHQHVGGHHAAHHHSGSGSRHGGGTVQHGGSSNGGSAHGDPGANLADAGSTVSVKAGGSLPFTGYVVTVVAAIGGALTAAGAAFRRLARRPLRRRL